MVPPGFWDYTQMIVRFSLVLILISAGVLFWSLSLARLQVAEAGLSARRVARTCSVGPRLFLAHGGRAADLQNRSALHVLLITAPTPEILFPLPLGGEDCKVKSARPSVATFAKSLGGTAFHFYHLPFDFPLQLRPSAHRTLLLRFDLLLRLRCTVLPLLSFMKPAKVVGGRMLKHPPQSRVALAPR